ncbi:AmmeMemoRadiSam system protein A [Aliikangiella sp. G2MR2-5]|uniref:AmmeMemoRadiSam system protein A n=1 Tax=Aliikangiella sp. G2MR2-5 TaxID=2788943 RepID=UPI0018AB16AE|nr:AmmeMemoRadiSam system protein A [Aliikangiella sp. G2MR2-5]
MPSTKLTLKDKQNILQVAHHAIQYGLTYKEPPVLELEKYSDNLKAQGASFVTLKEGNQLRGCIGTLEPYQPLIQDVAEHAYAAAFNDPRFPPVNSIEEPLLHISVSILSPPSEIEFASEADLLSQINPNVDGLILKFNGHKGTFLPSVWKDLPEKEIFLAHLKQKAGLDQGFWHENIRVFRYTTDVID